MEKTVLYAEDEFTNRRLIEVHLAKMEIGCHLAMDGLEALQMFRQNHYDIVILDQYMPGMNGDEVAREIRSLNKTVPLVAITSDDGEIAKLKEAGFNEVFIKPLRGKEYLETIKKYLA